MRFILKDCRSWKVQNPASGFPYSRQDCVIPLIFVPNTDDVLLDAYAEYATANLVFVLELIANEGKDEVFPEPICDSLAQPNAPLPSMHIHRIFPHWALYAGVEYKVVGGGLESRRGI